MYSGVFIIFRAYVITSIQGVHKVVSDLNQTWQVGYQGDCKKSASASCSDQKQIMKTPEGDSDISEWKGLSLTASLHSQTSILESSKILLNSNNAQQSLSPNCQKNNAKAHSSKIRLAHSAPNKSVRRRIVYMDENSNLHHCEKMDLGTRSKTHVLPENKSEDHTPEPASRFATGTNNGRDFSRSSIGAFDAASPLERYRTVLITQAKSKSWVLPDAGTPNSSIVSSRLRERRQERRAQARRTESRFLTRLRQSFSVDKEGPNKDEKGPVSQ